MKCYNFSVNGGFDIGSDEKDFDEVHSYPSNGQEVVGFKLPDGRTARPIIALEIESEDGSSFEYVTAEFQMAELGFSCLEYGTVNFERVADPNNDEAMCDWCGGIWDREDLIKKEKEDDLVCPDCLEDIPRKLQKFLIS
jgi:hypothetical protein